MKRLCKRHRIAANQNLSNMVECLAERRRALLDEDAAIESLYNVLKYELLAGDGRGQDLLSKRGTS